MILTIRKLADKSEGERVRRYHPETGQSYLCDPADDLDPAVAAVLAALPAELARRAAAALAKPKPWPLAGIQITDPPAQTSISTAKVAEGEREGWLELVDERLAHRPGGPADNPWQITHTFRHARELVFRTVDGDIRYRVTHQPDKYADPGDDTTPVTGDVYAAGATRVDHFYGLERIDG